MKAREKLENISEAELDRILNVLQSEDPASESYEQALKNFERFAKLEEEITNPKGRFAKFIENPALVGVGGGIIQIGMILFAEQFGHAVVTSLATRFVKSR